MDCQTYNKWRRDISAEYVLRTGRAYPPINVRFPDVRFRKRLVELSDGDTYLDPSEVVTLLIEEKLLKS